MSEATRAKMTAGQRRRHVGTTPVRLALVKRVRLRDYLPLLPKVGTRDIDWLAGLLEGEGSFSGGRGKRGSLSIDLVMTDQDVVEKVARLWAAKIRPRKPGERLPSGATLLRSPTLL